MDVFPVRVCGVDFIRDCFLWDHWELKVTVLKEVSELFPCCVHCGMQVPHPWVYTTNP